MRFEESGVISSDRIITGILYGGLAVLFKKCIGGISSKIESKSRRVLGIHIKGSDSFNVEFIFC